MPRCFREEQTLRSLKAEYFPVVDMSGGSLLSGICSLIKKSHNEPNLTKEQNGHHNYFFTIPCCNAELRVTSYNVVTKSEY